MKQISKDISGVYLIQNKINGKVYIGSAKCIKTRWRTHIRELDKKVHHSMKLQEDWIEFGEDNFEFKVLRECSHADSKKYEMEYIETFNSNTFGYNVKDLKDSMKRRYNLISNSILDYVKDNGFEEDGNVYWFNVFDCAERLNMKTTKLLEFFEVNRYKQWNVNVPISETVYAGLNWDSEDGVQIIAFHKSFFDNSNRCEMIKCS